MRRLVSLLVVGALAGSAGACSAPRNRPAGAPRSVREQLVDAFAEPLWGSARTVRYSITEPPWGSLEGAADLAAGRFAVKSSTVGTHGDAAVDAYVEGTHWWERSHTVDGDAWLEHDLRLDDLPLVTPQLPILIAPEGSPPPRYVTDVHVRRQVVEALLVSTKKLGRRQVRGVSATGYRVHLSVAAAPRALPAPLTRELARFGESDLDVTLDVWLDDAGTVRRVATPGVTKAQGVTIELWDHNASLTVARPNDLDRRPDDLIPPVDPVGRTELEVSTGPRIGFPDGDRRVITDGAPGVEFTARIVEMGGGASGLEVRVLSRPSGETARGWTITAATVGVVREGVFPLGDRFEWSPKQPVGAIDADEALVTKDCTGSVAVRELVLDTHGRPDRVSMAFSARCPSDGRDAERQFATTVSGQVHFHSLTP